MSERIDHMTYLPGMEKIKSDVMDKVTAAMEAYDYDRYTAQDVRRALKGSAYAGGLCGAAFRPPSPFLEKWRKGHGRRRESILKLIFSSRRFTLQTIARITAFTAALIHTTNTPRAPDGAGNGTRDEDDLRYRS